MLIGAVMVNVGTKCSSENINKGGLKIVKGSEAGPKDLGKRERAVLI
jgi:hypothetical protein